MVKPTHAGDYPGNNPETPIYGDQCLDWNDQRFRQNLELDLDARFATDGNSPCIGDITICLVDGTGFSQAVLACSLKATIDELVESWDDDLTEEGETENAAKNLLAVSDYLRAAAERLRAKATEERD